METTGYFQNNVLQRRPYLRQEWLEDARQNPLEIQIQTDGRRRHFIYISEMDKFLRVVFEGDKVDNAFLDRKFKPKSH